MTTPGGYGGYDGYQDYPQQQFDPLTGRPLQPGETAQYPQQPTGPETGSQSYQGFGQYPATSAYPSGGFPSGGFPQPTPPPRRRTGVIVGVIAAVLVIAVGAVLTVVLLNKKSDDQAGPTNPTTTSPAPTTSSDTPTTESGSAGEPQYPGWQTVSVPSVGVAYDVPPEWKIESGTDGVIQLPGASVTMTGVSTYKAGACDGSPTSFRAKVGYGDESTAEPTDAAKTVATAWADALADNFGGKTATPQTSTQRVNKGQTEATLAVVRITTTKDSCNPPAMIVAVMSFKAGSGTESLVLFGDQDVPDAITTDVVAKVLTSARPLS